MDEKTAIERVLAHVKTNLEAELATRSTERRPWGWLVSVTTAKFAHSGNPMDQIPGLGTIAIVDDGRIFDLPSSMPPARAIEELEKKLAGQG